MSETSPRLELPYLQPSQAQKHVTHNEALERLDVLTQLTVETFGANTPPPSPAAGETYVIGTSPSGDWAAAPGSVTMFTGSGWMFLAPSAGWRAWGLAEQELRIWDGADWVAATPARDVVETLGINATADATNRLTVASNATLLNNAGAGHQLKINKATAGDTASLLFQSNWAGHAEMGLAGDTAFSIKVSPDGGAWHEALRIDPVNQNLALAPNGSSVAMHLDSAGLTVDVPLGGNAVQTHARDEGAGRLMPVGAFGLGGQGLYLPDISVTDGSIATGFYQIDGATIGAPMPSGNQHLIHSRRSGSGGETQLVFVESDGSAFFRARTTGAWQAWQQLASSAHYTGNFSTSGASPIFESGTNLNGSYTRFADGTQLCWGQIDLSFIWERELYGSWIFPSTFQSAPKVFNSIEFFSLLASATPDVDAISVATVEGMTTTKSDFRLMRAAGQAGFVSGDSVTLTCFAVGRWK